MSNARTQDSMNTIWRVAGVPWTMPVPSTDRPVAGGRTKIAFRSSLGLLTSEPWQDWAIGFLASFFGLLLISNIMIPVPQDVWVRSLLKVPMRAVGYAGIVGGGLVFTGAVHFALRSKYPNVTRGVAFGMLMAVLVQLGLLLYWGTLNYGE